MIFFVDHLAINPVLIHKVNIILAKNITLSCIMCVDLNGRVENYSARKEMYLNLVTFVLRNKQLNIQ